MTGDSHDITEQRGRAASGETHFGHRNERDDGPRATGDRAGGERISVSRDINQEYDQGSKLGGRLADRVASFGGSWTFLIIFGALILAWVGLNTAMLAQAFDPYPYILLNLFLSLLASIQAPSF